MGAENKIRKRIEQISRVNGIKPGRIIISEEESNELQGIKELDGVELIRLEKAEIKTDCKFYNEKYKDCNAMTELICKNKNCKRYNTTITQEEIERSIRNYSLRRNK